MTAEAKFVTVYTIPEWYDGPRKGIADYRGHPHLFESDWQEGANLEADTFLLTPIDNSRFPPGQVLDPEDL